MVGQVCDANGNSNEVQVGTDFRVLEMEHYSTVLVSLHDDNTIRRKYCLEVGRKTIII